ncbi:DNA polymerase III subunit chi [Aliiruegeria sabulilitoris]|uniref:DNA polymerase III subunit chi n=1 Tax=Aliiruegeria sabulilitoris TaxID=1510458 RepID=UPI0008342BB7|nr:DNA polymerase III subunit chi [Aliiruegeria sabulilitoris]NDR56377.1 DNA polymerase III subunit chi [Pseudoruegeria sp. M32A2M]
MGQALFYHLTRHPLEVTLAMLLEKSLQRDWRVVVRGSDAGRLQFLDQKLWLGPEEGFLPHGLAGGPQDADQPVLLTAGEELPNGATVLMSIDGAAVTAAEIEALERVCILFDGHDPAAVQHARGQWKGLTGEGAAAQYWSEESGRWEMKAESKAG